MKDKLEAIIDRYDTIEKKMADQEILGILHLLFIKMKFLFITILKKIFFIRKIKKILNKKR